MPLEVTIPKKVLVFFSGLAGTGKRTVLEQLIDKISNSFKAEKDIINAEFVLDDPDFLNTEHYKKHVKNQTYTVLTKIAEDNLRADKVVFLQGYYGDKITSDMFHKALTSSEYEVKIVYLHCTGDIQLARLEQRNAARDADKLKEGAFPEYRKTHISKHAHELAQVPFLIVPTGIDADLEKNVEAIIRYIQMPSAQIVINPVKNKHAFTIEEAMLGASVFASLVRKIQPEAIITTAQQMLAQPLVQKSLTPNSVMPPLLFNRTTAIAAASFAFGVLATAAVMSTGWNKNQSCPRLTM
jgi:predicted kinase